MADLLGKCWPPGTASGYHALSYGHLVGELVRRISGKPLKQFVAEEIAGPLDTGRRMTISYMMNKMGPGIIGSDRSAEYGQAIYDAVAG